MEDLLKKWKESLEELSIKELIEHKISYLWGAHEMAVELESKNIKEIEAQIKMLKDLLNN